MAPQTKQKRPRRVFPGFTLQFPITELRDWAAQYPPEDDPAFDAGKKIVAGNYSRANLDVIVNWKSHRRAELIAKNTDTEIAEALRIAVSAEEPRTAFAVLMGLSGVAVPMASAILTSLDQKRYTIIDWRALEALGVPDWDITLNFYLEHYFPECRRLARAAGVNLRTVDRALWGWSSAQLR
jgi:hypothetical protein